MKNDSAVSLCAVGDVAAFHNNPESAFEHVSSVLREADITFCQNERHYSERTDLAPRGGFTELTTPHHAEALKSGGFDVISFASNHSMDLGPDIMLDTVSVLRKLGFAVIGVGKNIREARKPAIIEKKGTRIGFLAYASVLRSGYNATAQRAGAAPIRAWTLYNQIDYQPGTPPQILTFPYRDDLEALLEDVRKLRSQADIVAVSFHWGIHFVPATIATYQKEVAHSAIEAGADIILGHHPHVIKGIEVYKGKPVFYSMGNFAFDLPYDVVMGWKTQSADFTNILETYGWELDPRWKLYAFPPQSRSSMIVKCNIVDKKIQKVSFLPVVINQQAQPRIIPRKDKAFDKAFKYMNEITRSQKLETKYRIEGEEIVVDYPFS